MTRKVLSRISAAALLIAFLAYGTAAVPFYSAVKAFYGLAATVPLCEIGKSGKAAHRPCEEFDVVRQSDYMI